MALKITSQIGTDKGITSEAYVRIADYQISKYGSANFRLELFMSQADASNNGAMFSGIGVARNQQIGDHLYVPMTKEVEEIVTVKRMVSVVVEEEVTVPGPLDEEGNPTEVTETVTRHEMQEQDVEEIVTKTVPDMSPAEDKDIFEFGYAKLKEKLVALFGASNVIDC